MFWFNDKILYAIFGFHIILKIAPKWCLEIQNFRRHATSPPQGLEMINELNGERNQNFDILTLQYCYGPLHHFYSYHAVSTGPSCYHRNTVTNILATISIPSTTISIPSTPISTPSTTISVSCLQQLYISISSTAILYLDIIP